MSHRAKFRISVLSLIALIIFSLPAQAQSLRDVLLGKAKVIPPERRFENKIKMRDGTQLATLITLPEGKGPWPVILTRTPYGKETAGLGAAPIDFTAMGYAHVVQDTRGTGGSEGVFGSFKHEKGDGFDTIAWIGEQPWCDGKIGMFGVSASGILANFAAMSHPPKLVCTFVVVAHGCDFRFGSYSGGVFLKDLNERWFKLLGHPFTDTLRPRLGIYDDEAVGMDMQRHYTDVHIPTFNVCGWYDCFVESGIENFEGLQQHGSGFAKGNQKLVVGAFGHFPLNGKLSYPKEASKPDLEAVGRWFDHWLKGKENGIKSEPAVRYFLMGDTVDKSAPGNEWRSTNVWPPKGKTETLWLGQNGSLDRIAPMKESTASYDSDPHNPVTTLGGNNLFLSRGPMDQRETRNRKDVLRFETEPLTEPTAIVGRIYADLLVSTDAPDTDFVAKFVDIYPDGYEALVLDQAMRLRFREGFDRPQKAEAGKTYPLRINIGTTALVVNKGHRLAIHIQSTNSPRFEPHTNTWEQIDGYENAKVAHNTVHLGGENGSRVLLPVVPITSKNETAKKTE
jgi:predicted acyl esterase